MREDRHFRALLATKAASMVGDWAFYVAITVFIQERYHNSFLLGVLTVSYTIPIIVISPIAGLLADRVNRRSIMILVDLLGGASLVCLFFVNDLWLILSLVFLEQAISSFYQPAMGAIIPSVVNDKGKLLRANSLLSISTNAGRILGTAVGAFLVVYVPSRVAFLFDAGTYFLAAGLTFCYIPSRAGRVKSKKKETSFLLDTKIGCHALIKNAKTRFTALQVCEIMILSSLVTSFLIMIVTDVLGAPIERYGPLGVVMSFGAVLGGITMSVVKDQKALQGPLPLFVAVLASAMSAFALALNHSYIIAALLLVLFGLAEAAGNVCFQTTVHLNACPTLHGRLLGFSQSLFFALFLAAALVGGAVLQQVPIQKMFTIVCAGVVLIGSILALAENWVCRGTTADNGREKKSVEELCG